MQTVNGLTTSDDPHAGTSKLQEKTMSFKLNWTL